jgi:hypothetical protein
VSTQNSAATAQPNDTATAQTTNGRNATQGAGDQAAARALPPEAFLTQMAFGALMTQALHVVAKLGGAERTAEEYAALLSRAGLRMTRVIPTRSPFSIIEAEA